MRRLVMQARLHADRDHGRGVHPRPAGHAGRAARSSAAPTRRASTKAKADIKAIEEALNLFKLDNGFYPTSGRRAGRARAGRRRAPRSSNPDGYLRQGAGRSVGQRVPLPERRPREIIVASLGADGVEGGEGYNADIDSRALELMPDSPHAPPIGGARRLHAHRDRPRPADHRHRGGAGRAALPRSVARRADQSQTRKLATTFRFLQEEAILNGRVYRLNFDLDQQRYFVTAAEDRRGRWRPSRSETGVLARDVALPVHRADRRRRRAAESGGKLYEGVAFAHFYPRRLRRSDGRPLRQRPGGVHALRRRRPHRTRLCGRGLHRPRRRHAATACATAAHAARGGFTLVEVMVALTIVAFAFVGLLGLHNRNLKMIARRSGPHPGHAAGAPVHHRDGAHRAVSRHRRRRGEFAERARLLLGARRRGDRAAHRPPRRSCASSGTSATPTPASSSTTSVTAVKPRPSTLTAAARRRRLHAARAAARHRHPRPHPGDACTARCRARRNSSSIAESAPSCSPPAARRC